VLYTLRAIPLGGYVEFADDDGKGTYDPDDPQLLRNKSLPSRALVISAGVLANLVFSLAVLFAQVGGEEAALLPPPCCRSGRPALCCSSCPGARTHAHCERLAWRRAGLPPAPPPARPPAPSLDPLSPPSTLTGGDGGQGGACL
jgi:hypothetical protein